MNSRILLQCKHGLFVFCYLPILDFRNLLVQLIKDKISVNMRVNLCTLFDVVGLDDDPIFQMVLIIHLVLLYISWSLLLLLSIESFWLLCFQLQLLFRFSFPSFWRKKKGGKEKGSIFFSIYWIDPVTNPTPSTKKIKWKIGNKLQELVIVNVVLMKHSPFATRNGKY